MAKKDPIIFENKSTEVKLNETENVDYAYLLRAALRNVPQGGATIAIQEKRLPVLKKIADVEVGDKVEFTQGELNTVKNCVKTMPWLFVDQVTVDLSDYIESL
jgi:hypothetical protein